MSDVPAPGAPPRSLDAAVKPARTADELVAELVSMYREQVKRVLAVELDGSATSLAFVDHHLRQAASETRAPILALLAASAGAYFGEVVRTRLGGRWIGDGDTPRRLRMLMRHQFIYFSPVDQAFESILGTEIVADDPRLGGAKHFDSAFRLRPAPQPDDDETPDTDHDAHWLSERLVELPPVPKDHYVSLTCRFETLELIHELLATRHASQGKAPVELRVEDYLDAIAKSTAELV